MGLLALSTLLDYLYGFGVASANRSKARLFLWLSVLNNLGILAVFKYYDFFALQFKTGLSLLGLHLDPVLLNMALPVGISFYTFHGMSYVFDIYKGRQKPVSDLIEYGVFVSFFPLLVAGPIERAGHLLPQVQRNRTFNYTQGVEGCRLILWGMFKKVVLADSLAVIVDSIFRSYQQHNGLSLFVGAIAFAFQIYGDFSGYSDIAIGTAKLFGFELLSNFRFPYFSRDIAEFWRRWHISLSSWFRDYLYIPLGGSKQGKLIAVRNTFIIFLVSGFWHGASWNFVVWGLIHALGFLPLLLLNRNRKYTTDTVAANSWLPDLTEVLQMLGTFLFVTVAWIFFRAQTISDATGYIRHMVVSIGKYPKQLLHKPDGIEALLYIIPLVLFDWKLRHNERVLSIAKNSVVRYVIYFILILFILVWGFGEENMFIYYAF